MSAMSSVVRTNPLRYAILVSRRRYRELKFAHDKVTAASSTPLFRTLKTVWQFQPASPNSPHPTSRPSLPGPSSSVEASQGGGDDNGPTLVTLDLAFSFSNPVHAAVSSAFFGQVSRLMVKAFEERCLEVYGPGEK